MEFDLNAIPDLDFLSPQELRELYARLEDLYNQTEALEPDEEDSDEYDSWLEELEEVEDLMDEIEERLEEE